MGASVIDTLAPLLANASPGNFLQQRNLRQAQIGLTAAQAAEAQANAARQQQATQLGVQQTQAAQIQNQISQQSLSDQKILMGTYAKHADSDWSDPATTQSIEQELIKGGISYPGLADYRASNLKYQQGLSTLNSDQLALKDKVNSNIGSILDNYADIPDAQKPTFWAQNTVPALAQLGMKADPNNPLSGDSLNAVIGRFKQHSAVLKDAQTAAETKEKTAVTTGQDIKNQLEQAELAHYKTLMATPAALENYVEQNIPAAQYPQLHAAAVSQAKQQTDMKGVNAVVEKNAQIAREQEKTKALETDPQIGAFKLKQQQAEASYQNALQQGDKARGDYYSSYSDLNQTLAAAKTIEKATELARSGNPVAAQQLKAMVPEFTNAMQNIRRLGGMQGDKGFTSLWDTTINELSSAGGKPLTSSTLDQIMPYVRTIANGAADKHNSIVRSIKGTYGQDHPQEPIPYGNTANAGQNGAARKVGDSVTLKGGRKVTITKVYPDGSFDY